ncbi:TOMM precursor leader peptide-binding protein [Streptomyces sp. NPDC090127]|uniref:TOMM precursor leader peptide-binding protein n=1 Tax=Streptomyces sp. NPDC090127 TaxID=3365953 RepID=UPI003806CF59
MAEAEADIAGTASAPGGAPRPAPAPDAAFDALAGTRPHMRRDVLFTETPAGVLFHNADGGFHLTGKTAYRFAALVAPHLTGGHTLGELCTGFGPAQRAMAAVLVGTLYARSFARDVPETEAGSGAEALVAAAGDRGGEQDAEAVLREFAAQIAYVDHYVDGAPARFARFRRTRVAVLGGDETARWCGLSLVRNGCAHIGVGADLPEVTAEAADAGARGCPVRVERIAPDADWADLADYDVVIVTGAGAAGRTHRLLDAGVPRGRTLIPAWTFGDRSVIGPLATASTTGCWSCAVLRLGANTDAGAAAELWAEVAGGSVPGVGSPAPADGAPLGGPLTGPVAAMTGNLLGYEVFRLTTGALPAETSGQVLLQDLASLDVVAEPLHPHPRCRRCSSLTGTGAETGTAAETGTEAGTGTESRAGGVGMGVDSGEREAAPATLTLPVTASVRTAREAEDEVDRLNTLTAALVRPHAGVFRRYEDEDLTQTPLKISRLELSLGHGVRRRVAAFDVHHLAGARTRALYTAAEAYAEHVALPGGATAAPESGAPAVRLLPDALTTGGGTGTAADAVRAWASATSLLTKESVDVPEAAVRTFGPANRDRAHLATGAGVGAGASAQEAAGRGLLSALAHDALVRAVRGETRVARVALPPVDTDPVGTDDPELVFLVRSAANLDVTPELLDLGEDERSSAYAVLAREAPGGGSDSRAGDDSSRAGDDSSRAGGRWAVGAGLSRRDAVCDALRDLLGQAQLAAEDPSEDIDLGLPLVLDLAPATIAVTDTAERPAQGGADRAATTFDAVLDRLRTSGRDVLYVPTTPADLAACGVSTARVLVTVAPVSAAPTEDGAADAHH